MRPLAQDALWQQRRRIFTQRELRAERRQFRLARNAEAAYARQLRLLAGQIGQFVRGMFQPGDPNNPGWTSIIDALTQHAQLITDWAGAAANRMLADVDRREQAVWYARGKQIGRALRAEISSAPMGEAYNALLQYQIDQIRSISEDAADRISRLHDQARERIYTGGRWEDIVQQVMAQEGVSRSHANTIARTETARAQTTFAAVRAQHIGSEYFQWITAGDADVRQLHRDIAQHNGGVYRWDDPPILDDGRPGLPGTVWNCRCTAIPILPDEPTDLAQPARSPEYLASLRPEAAPINDAYRKGRLTYGQYVEKLLSL